MSAITLDITAPSTPVQANYLNEPDWFAEQLSGNWSSLCNIDPRLQIVEADILMSKPPVQVPKYWIFWEQFERQIESLGLSRGDERLASCYLWQTYQRHAIACVRRKRSRSSTKPTACRGVIHETMGLSK